MKKVTAGNKTMVPMARVVAFIFAKKKISASTPKRKGPK